VAPDDFSQILVNEYRPGAGIGWHHDSPAFGIVAGISLGGSCTMRFQHGSGEQRSRAALELPLRSIYFLTAEARQFMAASHRTNQGFALFHHTENAQKALQR
jgi:alkylated DNA repair dioxygenase AlkB